MIDNNMAPALAKELDKLCRLNSPTWVVCHSTDLPRVKGSSPDDFWIPQLFKINNECRWLIITKDYGAGGGKRGERLPLVCKSHGHAYVIMSANFQRTSEQKAAIVDVWKQFETDVLTAFSLTLHTKGDIRLSRQQGKKGEIFHQLLFKGKDLQKFIAEEHARRDSFKLTSD